MIPDLPVLAVTIAAVFLITFTKGAFGGGFAIIGIPLMALVMDPVAAGAVLAPMFCVSDIVSLRYWRASTWSKPDLMVLIPGQLIGVGLGFAIMSFADRRHIAIVIALVTLAFAALWFRGGGKVVPRPISGKPEIGGRGRHARQCFSGYLLMKPSRLGIFTLGNVSAFITSFSPMILLSARI